MVAFRQDLDCGRECVDDYLDALRQEISVWCAYMGQRWGREVSPVQEPAWRWFFAWTALLAHVQLCVQDNREIQLPPELDAHLGHPGRELLWQAMAQNTHYAWSAPVGDHTLRWTDFADVRDLGLWMSRNLGPQWAHDLAVYLVRELGDGEEMGLLSHAVTIIRNGEDLGCWVVDSCYTEHRIQIHAGWRTALHVLGFHIVGPRAVDEPTQYELFTNGI